MKTVFSGIQPTGELHLGNYLGAVRNWVSLQDEYRCIFCVVDYHALTQDYEAKEMAKRVTDMVIDLIALGIDPQRSLVFLQSMVPEHTELSWVLTNVTGFGDLERMTQFKDKAASQPDNVNVGLFQYPVLQAPTSCSTRPSACRSARIRSSTSSWRGESRAASITAGARCSPSARRS